MAEAFGFYADNLLTRDHFNEVLDARLAEQATRLEARMDARFAREDRRLLLLLHTGMLGLITLVLAVPQLQAWLA